MSGARIYLDHAATTRIREEAVQAMLAQFARDGNAGSLHAEGRSARAALDQARERIAAVLGAKPKEIVLTSGGTEADHLAIAGIAATRGRGHLIASAIEHHAVLHTLDALAAQGFEYTLLPVDSSGVVDPARFSAALRDDTILASIMYVNNEIGSVQPIAELAALAHDAGARFHTDAIAATLLPLDVNGLGVDLLSLSAHKFYGPPGVGLLYVREGTPLSAQLRGGSQEHGLRAGTQNVPGALGMAVALEQISRERASLAARLAALRERFERGVQARIPGARVNGTQAARAPHLISLALPGISSEALLARLDLGGIAASVGSACAAGAVQGSHVIEALGLPSGRPWGIVRLSMGRETSEQEMERALEVLARAAEDLTGIHDYAPDARA